MSSLNRTASRPFETNHNGLRVKQTSAETQLVRMTLAHMLWENQFYIDGQESAKVMMTLAGQVDPGFVSNLAKTAREKFKLRHVPLALMRSLAKNGKLQAQALADVIQRPDEMGEFLSIYRKDNKKEAISNQVKKGLALAFGKFNEYQLAKWDKNSAAFKVRDVMFLAHPKPVNAEQAELFKRIADGKLETPDTWETQLSAGADKGQTFERLMAEGKLGGLAFLRNLRNMVEAGISTSVIRAYGEKVNVDRVLPFRFLAAARIVPQFEDMLEKMMFRATAGMPKLAGKTKLYVDVSSSMYTPKVSEKSDLTCQDASLALAILCRELCEEVEIYSFSGRTIKIAPRRGFALAEAIKNSQGCSGTRLGQSLRETQSAADRIIVITDEQSSDMPSAPFGGAKGYLINVGSYKNGINHNSWTSITGFSEAVFDYIQAFEKENAY